MNTCPNCNQLNQDAAAYCNYCGANLSQSEKLSPADIERLNHALKETKLAKKKAVLLKQQIIEQERQVRAAYTEDVRERGSKVQGSGKLGRLFRMTQTVSRDARRRGLAQQLAPLEYHRQQIEQSIADLDKSILDIETHLLKNS